MHARIRISLDRIQEISFLVLGQLAVGGTLLLILPVLRTAGLSFYRTNGIVLLITFLLGLVIGGHSWPMMLQTTSSLFALGFALTLFIYNLRLWFRHPHHSPAALISASLLGNIGLILSILSYIQTESFWHMFMIAIGSLASNLLLGSGVLAMLLGHSYLTNPTLSIIPLRHFAQIFMGLAFIQGGLTVMNVMISFSSERIYNALMLNTFEGLYLWIRFAIGLVGPMILAPMILKTVEARATMSATGLLYVAMLMVIIGALFSHFFLLINGSPL